MSKNLQAVASHDDGMPRGAQTLAVAQGVGVIVRPRRNAEVCPSLSGADLIC